MTTRTPRPGTVTPAFFDPTVVREIRVEKSGEPYLYEDGKPILGSRDVPQSVWRLIVEGVALRTAHQKATTLVDTWRFEARQRGPEDTIRTEGAVGMLDHALTVQAPKPETPYAANIRAGRIWASCVCGETKDWPDKGMGHAHFGTWKTRHQDCRVTV